jgi:hypothetical protein
MGVNGHQILACRRTHLFKKKTNVARKDRRMMTIFCRPKIMKKAKIKKIVRWQILTNITFEIGA